MTELDWQGLLLIVGSATYIIGFLFTLFVNLSIGPVAVPLALLRALVWPVWWLSKWWPARYIKSGEAVLLYNAGDPVPTPCRVTVEGWGNMAAVRVGAGAIRRDQIRKDAVGNWFYRYEE